MSSEDPLASIAEGMTKGALNVAVDSIKDWAKRFRDKDLAFAEDPEIIELAKKQRVTAEYTILKNYTEERDLHILFQMGLSLRRLERENDQVNSLRTKILSKFGPKGLHTAQLIQNGFFNKYLASALERSQTIQQLKIEIKELLDNIENTVIFTKETDDVNFIAQSIILKLVTNTPKTFILCGSGRATRNFRHISKIMKQWIGTGHLKYDYEIYSSRFKEALFLNKVWTI